MDPIERFRMLRSDERWTPTEHRFTPLPRLATADAPRRWWAWAVPAVVVAAALAALAAFTLGGVLTLGQGEGPAAPTAPHPLTASPFTTSLSSPMPSVAPTAPAATAAPSTEPTLPPTTTPASDIAFCTPGELDAVADNGGPAAGTWHTMVRLTYDNGNGASCKITEVPSVQWLRPRDLVEGPVAFGPVVKASKYVIDGGHDYVLKPGDSIWVQIDLETADSMTATGGSCTAITPYGFQLTLPGIPGRMVAPFSGTKACSDGGNPASVSQIGYTPLGDDPAVLAKPSADEIDKCDPDNLVGEQGAQQRPKSGVARSVVTVTNFHDWCYLSGFPVVTLSDGAKSYGTAAAHDASGGSGGRVDIGPGASAYFSITQQYPQPPKKAPISCEGPNRSPSGFQVAITGYGSFYIAGLESSAPCAVTEGVSLMVTPYSAKAPTAQTGG